MPPRRGIVKSGAMSSKASPLPDRKAKEPEVPLTPVERIQRELSKVGYKVRARTIGHAILSLRSYNSKATVQAGEDMEEEGPKELAKESGKLGFAKLSQRRRDHD